LVDLFNSKVDFEILDPTELEGDSNKINYYKQEEVSRAEKHLTDKIQVIVDEYAKAQKSSMFTDSRKPISIADFEDHNVSYENIKQVVHNYTESIHQDKDIDAMTTYLSKIEFYEKFNSISKLAFNFEPKNSKAPSTHWFVCVSLPGGNENLINELAAKNQITSFGTNWPNKISLWKSNSAFEPFRALAQDLGTVSSKDIDSTPIISFFFCTFFAFCLADAVYGVILTVIAALLWFNRKTKPNFVGISKIFFFSGIFTFLIGALTGSWAGDILSPDKGKLLDSLGIANWGIFEFFRSFQFIDPINTKAITPGNIYLAGIGLNPIVAMLGFSLLLGLVVILSGYLINTVNLYRNKQMEDANTSLAWLFLITGILLWIADKAFKTNLGLAANALLLISVLSVFVFNSGTGIGSKIMSGLGSLWGLTGFFADILSFTRLIAVGLTGGIIGSVINLLSSLIYTAIPIPLINFVVLLGVLLIGHLFNFVISVFGAYINPLRLSYVEYLPKFLSGSERNMMPEKISLTHLSQPNFKIDK
jgi:hypothetical protein